MTNALLEFIRHAREKGMDHATIRVLLLSAGWRERDVAKALAEEGLDFPVPEPPGTGSAKEAFQYLLALTALCFVVVNFIVIAFRVIDASLPDVAKSFDSHAYLQSSIRWSMATLLVAFPLYFGFTRWISRDVQTHPERSKSPIRRWLTYLALFAAAVTITGDVVALLYGFFEGDLTTRFLLQVLVVLVVAAIVFCYYLLSLRLPEKNHGTYLRRLDWTFGTTSVALVALVVIAGFGIVESPFQARLRRFDERRMDDLIEIQQTIERQVVEYMRDGELRLKRPLPRSLEEVAEFVAQDEYGRDLRIVDPQTGKKYEYSVKSETSYELCAEFSLEEKSQYRGRNHPAGRYCFVEDVIKSD